MRKLLNLIKRFFGYRKFNSINELASYFKDDVSGLSFWLQQNIPWHTDELDEDIIEEANTTFSRGWGDCWGIACVAHICFKNWGWNSYILSSWQKNDEIGHSICVFRKADNLGYTNNGCLFYLHNNESDEQIAKIIYSNLDRFIIEKI